METKNLETKIVKLSQIVFDKNIYPRKAHDPTLVQRYAESMESIETQGKFVSVSEDMRLLDGRHRFLAYQTLSLDEPDKEIQVFVYPASSDKEAFAIAVELNSDFGWQMTPEDKKSSAIRMYQSFGMTQDEIARSLKIGKAKVNQWLQDILESERQEREARIWDMWLSCHSQQEIVETLDIGKSTISEFLQESSIKFSGNDSELFRNFSPEVYTIWNFSKATNQVRHFGNIPPEIIDNLLYYYTQPFDVVFDPFGGGGSTIDKCIERKRRYYVSDLTPIPARSDIRQWDITQGLPQDLPVPDLVFLDPPYWKQAEGKYSNKGTDLSNVELEKFLESIGNIAKDIKRKWNSNRPNGRLAIIVGPFYRAGEYVDLSMLCCQAVGKYLDLVERIQVPYTTQIVGGDEVNKAKADKRMIHLIRDLMVFGKRSNDNG